MTRTLAQRAAVVGGSIAGLLAARVLSEYFDEVVVLDSDEIEDGPVVHKSVPQGHHLHALLQGGLRVLSSFYPSFTDDLGQLGATRIAMGRDAVWYLPDGKAYNPTGSVRTPFDFRPGRLLCQSWSPRICHSPADSSKFQYSI